MGGVEDNFWNKFTKKGNNKLITNLKGKKAFQF